VSYILVVDDGPVDRQWAGTLLENGTGRFVRYACDGCEALEQIEAALPLLVVSDLQMPTMDGMQLVESIRQRFPHVPTILMTAHGSEDIAVQALLAGAADYVPKPRLAADLVPAVKSVLEITRGDRVHHRLWASLRGQELDYELENDLLLVAAVVDQFRQISAALSLVDPADSIRLAKALIEAMSNAIYRGNLELTAEDTASEGWEEAAARRRSQPPYGDRRVHVHARFTHAEAEFSIRDEGPGFDTKKCFPNAVMQPSQLHELPGRGLVLIRLFMDEVQFNPAGNEIRMIKRARPAPSH
jgi:CheY-like chemotaxis protein